MTTTNKKITFTLFISFLLILLVSCENFMHGAWVSEELKKQIEYANAPKVTVKMRVDNNDYGDIYPPSAVVAQGDTFTVEFTQKDGVVFKYWMITNPQTGEELDENCLVITEERLSENRAEKTIIRKITVVVNSLPEDAEIRPKCYFPTETVLPEFTKFNMARTEQNAKDAVDCIVIDEENVNLNKFEYYAKKENFGDDADATAAAVTANIQKHHVSSLWIDLEGYDANSGVDEIEIQEKLLWSPTGKKFTDDTIYRTHYALVPEDEKSPYVSTTINHAFKAKEDGVINVKIILRDKSGNEVIKELDLIKDTVCDVISYVYPSAWENYSQEQNKIKKLADTSGKETYNLAINLSCDKYEKYVKDMNGNVYDDYDMFYPAEDKNFTGHSRIVKVAIGYEGEALTEYAAEDFRYEYKYSTQFKGYSGYCMLDNIVVDALKDTIIQVTVEDTAGNQKVTDHIIHKAIKLDYVEVSNNKDFKFYYNGELIKYGYSVFYAFKEQGKETETVVKKETAFSGTNTLNDFKDLTGTLSIYLLKNEGNYIYTLGYNPYIIYQGVDPAHVETLTNDNVPAFTYAKDDPVPNKGARTVSITYEQGFEFKPNLKYFIEVSGGALSTPKLIKENSFELPTSDSAYTFQSYVVNEKGEKHSVDDEYHKKTNIMLNDDNIGPGITDGKICTEIMFPNTRILYLYKGTGAERTFDKSGLKKDKDAQGNEIDFMTIKYVSSANSRLLQTGIDWTDTSIVKSYTQPHSNNTLYLPFDGDYNEYCYVHLEDTKNNYSDLLFHVENTYLHENWTDAKAEYYNRQGRDSIKLTWEGPNTDFSSYPCVTSFYLKDGEWKTLSINTELTQSGLVHNDFKENETPANQYHNPDAAYNSEKHNYEYIADYVESNGMRTYTYKYTTLQDDEKLGFIKAYIWFYRTTYNSTEGGMVCDNSYYWNPVYFYAPYILNKTDPTPSNKNYYEGALGVNVLTDKPCLVHTLYCSVDLGDKQSWLNGGLEAKVQTSNGSFTYVEPDDIPSGKYYTTIIHYADGDFCMTPVKYKN